MVLDPHLLLVNDADRSIGRRSSGWESTLLAPGKKFAILLFFLLDVIGGRGKGGNPIGQVGFPDRLAGLDHRAQIHRVEQIMPTPHIPQPQNVRRISGSFAWIDHRLLRGGYLEDMTHAEMALYLFLVLAADRHGVSFYRKEKICDFVALDFHQFEVARDRLIGAKLIAFEPYSAFTPNGYYQVLAVDETSPATQPSEILRLTKGLSQKWLAGF